MNRKVAAGIVASLVAIVVIVVIAIAVGGGGETKTEEIKVTASTGGLWPSAPAPWSTEKSDMVALIRTKQGPQVHVSPKELVTLTPQIDGLDLEWSVSSQETIVEFTGTGTWRDQKVAAKWVFAQGNPQATLEIDLGSLPRKTLTEPIVATLDLPVGDVRYLDNQLRAAPFVPGNPASIDGWTPGWMRWRGPGRVFQVSQWWADSTTITEDPQSKHVKVAFTLVDPKRRASVEGCPEGATVNVGFRMMVTFGDPPFVVPGRFEGGMRAMVSPVFIDPGLHTSKKIQGTASADAARFSARGRTLTLGHSSKADPRHGNGGLAGVGLGGTLVVQGDKSEEIAALRQELAGRVDVVETASNTALRWGPPACSADSPNELVWLDSNEKFDGGYTNFLTTGRAPVLDGSQTAVHPLMFDGSLKQLVNQGFSGLYLERLVKERGLFSFATPLVASRNPLTKVAKEALLIPERDGQWTLSPDVERALADIEFLGEESRLGFSTASSLVNYWRDARRATVQWDASGNLHLTGASDAPKSTWILAGARGVEGEGVASVDVDDRSREPQTWVVVSVSKEPSVFGVNLEPESRLKPTSWKVQD